MVLYNSTHVSTHLPLLCCSLKKKRLPRSPSLKMVSTAVLLSSIVILLQLTDILKAQTSGTHLPQYCSAPQCREGSYLLDSYPCQCVNFTKSISPPGTSEVVSSEGLCSSQAIKDPQCEVGYTLNPDLCVCKIKVPPSCPDRTHLVPSNALCFGVEEPTCNKGYSRVGCKCVKNMERKCDVGELTEDGCQCKNTNTPECPGGCTLSSANGQCACEDRRQIQCYYSTSCAMTGRYVSSADECCYGYPEGYSGDRSRNPPHTINFVLPHSYRVGNGDCYMCSYYYYFHTHNQW